MQHIFAYLVDIFEYLNGLNKKLQGKNRNRIDDYDVIRSFVLKLQLWKRKIKNYDCSPFANFKKITENDLSYKNEKMFCLIEKHLTLLENEFRRYFPDLNEHQKFEWKLARNPFYLNEDDLPNCLQEEFLEMKGNSRAIDDFMKMNLNDFWTKYFSIYKNISKLALQKLLPFSSTYLCECSFSTLVSIKT